MVRNSLLKLISTFLIFMLYSQIVYPANFVIDDFEDGDVSDWSNVGFTTLSATSNIAFNGSYSMNVTITAEDEQARFSRPVSSILDFARFTYINLSVWINTTDFLFEVKGISEIIFDDGNSVECSKTPPAQTDGWNNIGLNLSNLLGSCNMSDIQTLEFGLYEAFANRSIFLDQIYLYPDSCSAPSSGNWVILGGDSCVLNTSAQITGVLNISNGALQIAQNGELNISGGFAYIYPGSNLTILSGGELHG